MKIAVIPARGGSKRIPRKNIRPFAGQPIIAYSIAAARESGLFDSILVSTDDEEIAAVARACGASVPFVRPAALADDFTGTNAVVKHALQWFASQGEEISHACCVYATAPFVQARYLQEGFRKLSEAGREFAFSVTSFPFPIQRAIRLTPEGGVGPFFPEHVATRSQDLEEAFHDAGQFYWGTRQAFIDDRPIFSGAAAPVVIPRHLVQDIDTLEDWRQAELLYQAWRLSEAERTA